MTDEELPRIVSWFSAGAASAIATKLVLDEYGTDRVVVARIDPGSEHPDNARFAAECEEWFGVSFTLLASDRYKDTWDVWQRTGGPECTVPIEPGMQIAACTDDRYRHRGCVDRWEAPDA